MKRYAKDMKKKSEKLKRIRKVISLVFFFSYFFFLITATVYADLPASSNYKLQNYSFGAGGTTNSTSTNYGLNGIAGEVEFGRPSSANYQAGSGLTYMMKANVPDAPTLSTPNNSYDRILFVLDIGGNTSDTTFALEISTSSDFSTGVNYIKQDSTVGSSLTTSDYKTYTNWGGASGTTVTGLTSATTYYVRAKARQGDFTESEYGPSASITTQSPALTFTIDNPAITFNNLNSGNSYTDSSQSDTLTTTTNAINGYTVYGRETQTLTKTAGVTIADYLSPNSAPTAWSGLGFGYTTNDTTLGGTGSVNRFNNGTYYAGFGINAPGDPLDDNTGPVSGDAKTVSYRVTVNNATQAGTYRNTIVYTIVPTY